MSDSAITPHILESLRNLAAYPVATGTVELLQTHISWLFLTDSHVFKLKKPVSFGFLDFSTLELRRFYCHEELRLNRRLCPDMYEQVIPLRASDGGASFVGEGAVIDYAVMMKRLPADGMLDRLVDSGRISVAEIQAVALKISQFHAAALTSPYIAEFGTPDRIRANWQENFEQVLPFSSSTLPTTVRAAIRRYVETFIASHHTFFNERITQGFIRECDGDIHLGNICLVDSTPYIFDCIEFNERFRNCDTASDIAFLLMDLDFHHRPDLADAALSAYIEASGDAGLARLVTFYRVYRAFVRGKVESLRLLDTGVDPEERADAGRRASRYFRLAQGYCVRSGLSPTLFITSGTMGCGKSTLAGQLAEELGLSTHNSDVVRKQLAGPPPENANRASFGEGLYSEEMNRATYRRLEQLAAMALDAGQSVVIDACFISAAVRAAFARLAASRSAAFVILSVQCDYDEQLRRLRERTVRGTSVSDGRAELLDQQRREFEIPQDSEGVVIPLSAEEASDRAINSVYGRLCLP